MAGDIEGNPILSQKPEPIVAMPTPGRDFKNLQRRIERNLLDDVNFQIFIKQDFSNFLTY